MLILALNPGSTSTKLGLFQGMDLLVEEIINHRSSDLAGFDRIVDQEEFRLKFVRDFLQKNEVKLQQLEAIVGRGGLIRPVPDGTYLVNQKMLADLHGRRIEEHASNLGGIIAHTLAVEAGCPAYIVDPVIVDELSAVARYSGSPELERRSIFHALNQKAVARKYAAEVDRDYRELSLIIAHLGGGISVGLHHQGRVIDVNNALSGEGPFSPTRAGGLPTLDLVRLCFSGKFDFEELKEKLLKKSGLIAYLGTNDIRDIEDMVAAGNEKALEVYQAMIYQVGKEIGSLAPVLGGEIDAIILTGGIAHSHKFVEGIKKMVDFIAPIRVYPGEEELQALAAGAYRVLTKQEEVRHYREELSVL